MGSLCRDTLQRSSQKALVCCDGRLRYVLLIHQWYHTRRLWKFQRLDTIREVSCCNAWMAERIHRWTEVVGVVFFGVFPVVTSPTKIGCSVVYCSVIEVVVVA